MLAKMVFTYNYTLCFHISVKGVNVQGRIFGHGNDCNGCCKIGEGDCDGNGDCCSGLVCVDDSWHDYDHCEPGTPCIILLIVFGENSEYIK